MIQQSCKLCSNVIPMRESVNCPVWCNQEVARLDWEIKPFSLQNPLLLAVKKSSGNCNPDTVIEHIWYVKNCSESDSDTSNIKLDPFPYPVYSLIDQMTYILETIRKLYNTIFAKLYGADWTVGPGVLQRGVKESFRRRQVYSLA